jgi:C1A family cysteine protease
MHRYPYQGKPFKCALDGGKTVNGSRIIAAKARIKSYVTAGNTSVSNQDDILKLLVDVGPGNIGVDATCLFGYKSGIITNCTGKSVDHATLLVGAGTENKSIPYWIVKNSWGPKYGEEGYYRMERNTGQCDFHGAAFPIAK